MFMLSYRYPAAEGGVHMEVIITFLVAVAAGVACHYIIKWLRKEESPNCTAIRFGDSFLCPYGLIITFCLVDIIAYAGFGFNIKFLRRIPKLYGVIRHIKFHPSMQALFKNRFC